MPNLFAMVMLVLWPLVTVVLFLRLAPARALIATVLVGYLLLPPAPALIDLPLMPDLGKEEIPILAAFLVSLVLYRPGIELLPRSILARILLAIYIFSPIGSALTNPEPLVYGPVVLPGLGLKIAAGAVILQAISIMPFLLARHFLVRPEDRRDLVLAILIGGLVYSLPVLLEIRLAPQINVWVYGYFQHSFEQMMRSGGFRPIVFLYHALWVAFFMMMALVAAAAFARESRTNGRGAALALLALGWLAVTLVLGKSYAAIFYGLALVPAVLFLGPRLQLLVALVMALVMLAWPVTRVLDIMPVDQIVALAGELGPDRAHTLAFRFDNETALAQRALEKPLFGWGQWGRNQIYSHQTGTMLSVTDGRWVIVLGMLGITGLVTELGLLALPLVMLWRRRAAILGQEGVIWTTSLALMLGVNMFDLIPNATITPLTWIIAGAMLAVAESHLAVAEAHPVGSRRREPTITTVL